MDTNVRFACPGVTNPLSKFVLFTSQTSTNQEKCGHKDTRPPLKGQRVVVYIRGRGGTPPCHRDRIWTSTSIREV